MTDQSNRALLTLNAGSSSVKFGIYRSAVEPELLVEGVAEKLNGDAALHIHPLGGDGRSIALGRVDHETALQAILRANEALLDDLAIAGVGHRIVHGGMAHTAPTLLDDTVIAGLEALSPLAPLHQPHNLVGVQAARKAFPNAVQVGCFDTAFHRGHPFVNDTFGLPRHYYERGVRRYGFHGLSYEFITAHLQKTEPALARGRVVVAHLGNGASMCAIHNGQSIASSMGFSAIDGLMMGTRCGQIDPGVLLYMMQNEGMDADAISDLLYKQSGLKGMSGVSNDMRELLASDLASAKEAIDYYVFRIRRELGGLTAALGGLDGLVFCGGIGENAAPIRSMVCEGMDWLGIGIDDKANQENARHIGNQRVRVMVIPTDEERVIARAVVAELKG